MKIATLTINPSLDKNTVIERLIPSKKLRCESPEFEPGGGGLNVSRAIKILGGESYAIYTAGGATGDFITEMLNTAGIKNKCIRTESPTRENLLVFEKSTGNEFRFGMPGNEISPEEVRECIESVENLPSETEYLVASGSLPPGVPDDFYERIADVCRRKNIKCIIDTSGKALVKAANSGVYLIKPNLGELSQLAGKKEISHTEQEEIARQVIGEGRTEILIVSMGSRGAMLATRDITEYLTPPTVIQKSTVGAGDSMVAAMILSLSRGEDLRDAFKWGIAAGTAATMTMGKELCRREDVERIYGWLNMLQL